MSQTTTQQFSLENLVLFLSAILGAGAAVLSSGGLSGVSAEHAFLFAAIAGAASKAVMSFGKGLNVEDAILFVAALFSAFELAVGNNPTYAVYGLVVGTVGKSLPSLAKDPQNWGDWLLLLVPLLSTLAGLPQVANNTTYSTVGLFFGFLSKSLADVAPGVTAAPTPVPTTS